MVLKSSLLQRDLASVKSFKRVMMDKQKEMARSRQNSGLCQNFNKVGYETARSRQNYHADDKHCMAWWD